ncbi:MAG: carboxylating nicotinate-nucleotide diphosphorylase [Planctomycetota bacterium]|jgi:nicotinate-nucleotide pyrophosphorylase (carboxylating)
MDLCLTQQELENCRQLLAMARAEDLGMPDPTGRPGTMRSRRLSGDITSTLLPEDAQTSCRFVARQKLVVCGAALLDEIAAAYDAAIETNVLVADGQTVEAGEALATWEGPAASVFAAERVALNFLQQLSGIATLTRQYVDAVAGTSADIYDTRKTTPAWRALAKYAVRAGGGRNHRMGLYDAVLVKDNHLVAMGYEMAAGSLNELTEKLNAARQALGETGFVEIEVDTLEQFDAALTLPVDVILLDNFTSDQQIEAVARRNAAGLKDAIALEASGGVTFESVRQIAETGVDRIAIGALTHSAPAVDIGLDAGPA